MSWALKAMQEAEQNASAILDRARAGSGGSDGSESGSGISGLSGLPGRSKGTALEAYKHYSGWVYSSIWSIGQRVASQPLQVARVLLDPTKQRSKTFEEYRLQQTLPDNFKGLTIGSDVELIPNHPLIEAVNDPNDIMVRWVLLYVTVANLELTGRCLWWITDPVDNGRFKEIWPIPTHWAQEKHTKGRLFDHWEITPPGSHDPVKVPSEEVACFYYPDPANPIGFTSPLMAQAKAVLTDEMIQQAQKKSFINGLNPGLAVIMGRHPEAQMMGTGQRAGRIILDNEQKKVVMNSFRQFYGGVDRWDSPVILDGLVEDVKKLNMNPREMDYLNSSKMSKERITQGFSTNPIVLGQVEGANRASSATAEQHHVNNAVNPKICLISECLTAWVAPMFETVKPGQRQEKLVAYLEKVVPRDVEVETKTFFEGAKLGFVTVNEFRQNVLHLPPIHGGNVAYTDRAKLPVPLINVRDDEPADDDFGVFPGQPEDFFDDDSGDGGDSGDDDKTSTLENQKGGVEDPFDPFGKSFSLLSMISEHEGEKVQIETWDKQLSASEKSVEAKMQKVFERVFKSVVSEVRSLPEPSGNRPEDVDVYVDRLIDEASLVRSLKIGIKSTIRPIVAMGASTEWSLNAPRKAAGDDLLEDMPAEIVESVDKYTDDLTRQPFWRDMSESVKKDISSVVNEGLQKGWSTEQIAEKLDHKLERSSITRARRIARTETTGALNAGHHATRQRLAKDGLVAGKKWQGTLDGDIRDAHANAHNQKKTVNEMYSVGGEQAMYPGDPVLSAANRANCRCASLSIMSLGAREGKVLLPQAANNASIARVLGITPTQAQGFIRLAGETSTKLLGGEIPDTVIRSTVGKVLNKVAKTGTKMKGYVDTVQQWMGDTKLFKAMNAWWNGDNVYAKLTRALPKGIFKGYMKILNTAIDLAGSGLPPGVRQGGYWTGILVSQALTPSMPFLAIPGMSDLFAISSLLGVQVPFRIYQATRWAGKKVLPKLLNRVTAGGISRPVVKGAISKVARENMTSTMEKLATHGNPVGGKIEDLQEMTRQLAQLQPSF